MNNRRAWAAIASFPPHPQNVRHARRITRTALAAWGAPDLIDSAEMLVSELVTNALQYGRGPVDLTLALTGQSLRIAVTDEGTSLPVPRTADADAQSGRGLSIVDTLADSWEVVVRLTGKTVTCVLAVKPAAVSAGAATSADAQRPRVRSSGEHGA
ncbi:anti-sigma regulatory factor (Ser/Thr protein kinase) [Streptacidiphilus sp. MAP12-16]|uniref:ATP-binding protein n=1 Tax=Streptacidiphilus sp. MAP12-16 TaxID=3156300 RepID=UPI0035124477